MSKKKQEQSVAEVKADVEAAVSPDSHISIISEFGCEIVRGTLKVGETYFRLCTYIRSAKVEADIVRKALEPLGFVKQRITEINRVSNAPEELWSEYEARALSFRRTLELTRGTVQLLLEKAEHGGPDKVILQRTLDEVRAEEIKTEEAGAVAEAEGNAGVTEKETSAVKKERMEIAARKLAGLAEKYSVKSRVFKLENGYVVTVSRSKAVKVVGAPVES